MEHLSMGSMDSRALESARIDDIISDRTPPVPVTASMEGLMERALEQNFIPVVDDRDMFVGIVTRRSILAYYTERELPVGDSCGA